MRRVIVLGGLGHFGRAAADMLRMRNVAVLAASRGPGADLLIDAESAASLSAGLRENDLVIDAAGPFQSRSTRLVEAAVRTGFDIIDLNDSLSYAEKILALEPQITAASIRVLSGASTVSAVSAAVIRQSGMAAPRSFTAFLAPATRHTANAGAARSLVESVGRPVRVWRDGRMQAVAGWSEPRHFPLPPPVGPISARLFESADALLLPRIWPTLQHVALHVDPRAPGLNALLRLATLSPVFRRVLASQMRLGTRIARVIGSAAGGLGYEIAADNRTVARYAITAAQSSQRTAVAPAVRAALNILENHFEFRGLVPPDKHAAAPELFALLKEHGIHLTQLS